MQGYEKRKINHKVHKVLNIKFTKEFSRLLLTYIPVNKLVAHSPPFGGVAAGRGGFLSEE